MITITDLRGDKPRFAQWDVDRALLISGTEVQPSLRFANDKLTRALVVVAEEHEDGWLCKVPNFMLQFCGPMAVSVFEQTEDEGREIYAVCYPVQPRMKPQDYTYEENIGYVNWVTKSQEAEELLEQMRVAVTARLDAEAWAVGTRDDEPVAEDDETYENNAKYYANALDQRAAEAGFMFFAINEDGDLIYTRTPNIPYQFALVNGDLVMEVEV